MEEPRLTERTLRPVIKEYKKSSSAQNLVVVLFGILAIFLEFFLVMFFSFSLLDAVVLGIVLIISLLILSYLMENTLVREVHITKIKELTPQEKINYVGSTKTKTYHLETCRLIPNIKKESKIIEPNKEFFIKNKFKPCKICLPDAHN